MTTPNFPTVWFWVVQDTNPTTQVFDSTLGLEANTSADYLSWVANGGRSLQQAQYSVAAAQDNGSGAIRITIGNNNNLEFTANDVWVIQNVVMAGATVINGVWPVTPVNSNQVDLQGSTFVGGDNLVTAGVIDRGSVMPTLAGLYVYINSYNISIFNAGVFYNEQTFSISGGDVTIPSLLELTIFNNPGGSSIARTAILPQANLPGGLPIGISVYLQVNTNDGAGHAPAVNIHAHDGTTPVAAAFAGDVVQLILAANTTANGTWTSIILPFVPVQTVRGGLGTNVAPSDGQIPIGQGGTPKTYSPKTLSGDGTLSDAGTLTVTSTSGVPFGPFATLTAPLAIVYGGTQTTVAPSAGQILIAQSGSLYSPTALVGGATLAASGTVILANPAAAVRGGVFSHASVASQFLVSLDTSGSLTGAQPAFGNLTGVASVAQGGTNQTAAPSAGQVLIAQSSTAFAPITLSGGATVGAGGTVTLGTPGTAVLGGLFSFASVSNQFLTSLATSGSLAAAQPALANLSGSLNLGTQVTGTLAVASGGTGQTTGDYTPNGAWTPTDQSGGTLTFSSASVAYSRAGNMVFVYGRWNYPTTSDSHNALVGGLPVTVVNALKAQNFFFVFNNATGQIGLTPLAGTTTFQLTVAGGSGLTNSILSGARVVISFSYPVT